MTRKTLFNTELLHIARDQVSKAASLNKGAFVPAGPAAEGAPMADPMAGAMPPMPGIAPGDPAAMAAADPAAMAAVDPAAAGSPAGDVGGSVTETRVQQMIQQALQQGGAGGPAKKKVDLNTEVYHIKRMLVQLLQSLGQQVDPSMLLGDPAEDPYASPEEAAGDPASAAAQPGAMQSAIKPPEPIQPASPELAQGESQKKAASLRSPGVGISYPSRLPQMRDKAAALRALIQHHAS